MEKEVLDVIKGAISEGLTPVQKELDALKPLADGVKGIDERLKKIEASPVGKTLFNVNTSPSVYKGYRLSHMGRKMRDAGSKDPVNFEPFSSDEKADEFCKFMIDFIKATSKNVDLQAKADLAEFYRKANMVEGTAANGGYLVPDEYLWTMVQLARSRAFALRDCTVVPMNTDQMYLPAELTLASVAWTTPETGQMTAGEPTFSQVSLTAKRLDGIATVTNELLMDSAIDIVSLLSEQFGYAVAIELDNQVLNGTGNPVSGLLGAACGYSATMGSGSTNFSAITADLMSEAVYKLSEADLANAKFYINRIGLHYARTLKDSNNRPLFADLGGPVPGTLYGFPYMMSEKITNTSAVSTAMALFGDMKKFIIGRRLGATSLDVDPYGKFDYFQTRYRIVSRWALAAGRSTAFCRIITAAS